MVVQTNIKAKAIPIIPLLMEVEIAAQVINVNQTLRDTILDTLNQRLLLIIRYYLFLIVSPREKLTNLCHLPLLLLLFLLLFILSVYP